VRRSLVYLSRFGKYEAGAMETPRRAPATCNGPSAQCSHSQAHRDWRKFATPVDVSPPDPKRPLCAPTGVRSLDRNSWRSSLVTRQAEEEENSFVS
jgi:hypothetical protein